MSEQSIIGKGTWIDKLAHELLEREKTLGRNMDLLRVESGLGASGVPHIGSLGDAVRAYGVKLALENFGYKSELIAYSDDLDGLRKIPEGFPDSLKEHLGKSVSAIPDPFDCHDSYGMHMSSLLLEGLDKLGIKYDFRRAKDTYEKGLLKEQIHTILENSKKIGEKISELTGQEKFQQYLPYFPVCTNCDKIYTTESFEYISDVKYEMFLDKGGKKISKSLGNVVTSQTWLKYGSPKSILLLLYKRISGARELGFEDIPSLMDEYNELENIFFGKIKIENPAKETKMKGLYEYVNLLNTPKTLTPYVSYRLLIELSRIFKEKRTELVMKKLIDYGVLKNSEPQIEDLITMAGNYADDFDLQEKVDVQIDDATKKALGELADLLGADDEPDDLQNTIYQIAKKNNVQPKDFFKILYQIILSTNRGPKIGPFILDIGRKKVSQTLASYL